MTPCIGLCTLDADKDVCVGCHRTVEQITKWSIYTMSERMEILEQLRDQHQHSFCPSCGSPNKCAMEQGKSASTCWCMSVTIERNPNTQSEVCLCKKCLKEHQ